MSEDRLMKELKFRAIINPTTTIFFTMQDLVNPNPRFSILEILIPWLKEGNIPDQYITRKDKNKKEIYEGDRIRVPEYTWEGWKYPEDIQSVDWESYGGYFLHITGYAISWDDCEIILPETEYLVRRSVLDMTGEEWRKLDEIYPSKKFKTTTGDFLDLVGRPGGKSVRYTLEERLFFDDIHDLYRRRLTKGEEDKQ